MARAQPEADIFEVDLVLDVRQPTLVLDVEVELCNGHGEGHLCSEMLALHDCYVTIFYARVSSTGHMEVSTRRKTPHTLKLHMASDTSLSF